MTHGDETARELIRSALGETLFVEAAAGTGKTTELTRRVVAVLQGGAAPIDGIVAVTFTEKAAGELKLRLRAALEEARGRTPGPVELLRLEAALSRLEEARIGTIHAFCADLLRERPVEAGVDPLFVTLTQDESERLLSQAFRSWLEGELQAPSESLRRALRRRAKDDDDTGPIDKLRRAAITLAEWRDLPAAWKRPEFPRVAMLDQLANELFAFQELSRDARDRRDPVFVSSEKARRLAEEVRSSESVRDVRDHDGLESSLVTLANDRDFMKDQRKGKGEEYREGVRREEVREARDRLREQLALFAQVADADLAAGLKKDLGPCLARYEELKVRTGALDFLDLLVRARDLLRSSREVRGEFQERFRRIFVDEFQDTDPLQAEILLLLSGTDPSVSDWREVAPEPGKLFLVGDPKQAIYRFRRADVGTYLEVRERLAARGARVLALSRSFRGVPSLQAAVNAAFAPEMTGSATALQADYLPLEPAREELPGQPSLVALPIPEPLGPGGRVSGAAIDRSLPDAVGAFLEWLLTKSGWTVTERSRPTERVPVEARHVCLLFRRFESWGRDVTRPYVQALESRDIRHLLVGGKSYHSREEVEVVRNALSAIERPEDELSVFATLKGPLFSIFDTDLLAWRARFHRFHPFQIPKDVPKELEPIAKALSFLASLTRERNRRPVAETLWRLLDETRAHAGFVFRPAGEQALANVLHVAELARQYERSGGLSFRGFVDRLREVAESGNAPEAPILEEDADGVRLMTVHRAKGLEFPVVLLADITAKLTSGRADRHLDAARSLAAVRLANLSPYELHDQAPLEIERDRAEGVRIAYVAATRARDLLIVPAVGSEKASGGWTSPLHRALYPERGRWRTATKASRCPAFGPASMLGGVPGLDAARDTVQPGRHDLGVHAVVWWDPSILKLDAPDDRGIRQEDLLGTEADWDVAQEGMAAYEAWKAARAVALEKGSRPSVTVRTVTDASSEGPVPANVDVVDVEREPGRPFGPRFGTLVHAILAAVPYGAAGPEVADVAAMQARVLGATPDETAAATRAVTKALAHPLLRDAARAEAEGGARREASVVYKEGDGSVVEGIVDLAFLRNGTFTVVDFKTDIGGALVDSYRRQVGLYADAIARATGRPTRAVLLRV